MPGYEAVVSYADSASGHHGGVYRAASWTPLGISHDQRSFRDVRTGRIVARRSFHNGKTSLRDDEIIALGYEKTKGNAKHRYARGLTRSARLLPSQKQNGPP